MGREGKFGATAVAKWIMKINLHIERLVLDGLAVEPQQRPLLLAALEAELGGLLAQNGLGSNLSSGGAFRSVRADVINVAENSEPSGLGRQIAQSIHGGISR